MASLTGFHLEVYTCSVQRTRKESYSFWVVITGIILLTSRSLHEASLAQHS